MTDVSPPSPRQNQMPPGFPHKPGSGLPGPKDLRLVKDPISAPGEAAAQDARAQLKLTASVDSHVHTLFEAPHDNQIIALCASLGTKDPSGILQAFKAFKNGCDKLNIIPTTEQLQAALKKLQQHKTWRDSSSSV